MTENCSKTTARPNQGEVAYGYWQTLSLALNSPNSSIATTSSGSVESVSVEQYIEGLEEGVKHEPLFGLKVGQSVSLKTFPVLGMTLLSCSTLRQALEQILRYETLNHDLGSSGL